MWLFTGIKMEPKTIKTDTGLTFAINESGLVIADSEKYLFLTIEEANKLTEFLNPFNA